MGSIHPTAVQVTTGNEYLDVLLINCMGWNYL